ncbi:hypothetical protein OKW45_006776 [Paraburkholderia sp. WSM4175]|uniref:hypothetical protein n=1 Tax=Paraburkholderia sp. WSM4175 TaxID=2991072 RepID=UPI003D19FABE
MPAIPTTIESTPTTFTPAFTFVPQMSEFDDIWSCCAMISGKTIEQVREIAVTKLKHPARGPFYYGETHIAALLAQLEFVGSVYKEISKVSDIPDLALILVNFHEDMQCGRHILFHRGRASHTSGTSIEYAIDPSVGCVPAERIRNNFKNIAGHWVIGIHSMNIKTGTGK